MISAVGSIGIIARAPAAEAQQFLAPGQTECNPGQQPGCPPPGQNTQGIGNPGHCQKTLQEEFGLTKEEARESCGFVN